MNDTDMNDMNSTRAKRSWAGDAPALLGLARDRLTFTAMYFDTLIKAIHSDAVSVVQN